MLHYAYVKNINSNSTYRYAIVFASRAVADEWWHAVSTSAIVKFSDSIRRVNAQFYTHDVGQANAADSLTVNGVATQFLGKVFFTLLDDLGGRQLSIIPPLHFADHISENSFYIRSKVSPYEYWYCPLLSNSNATNLVYVSRTERTRFRVCLAEKGTAGTVMIGSDEIVITVPSLSRSIDVTDSGQVILATAPQSGLKFSDLLSKFTVGPTVYKDGQSLDTRELLYTDDGEKWELA
ncbi:hypothetical protein EV702DRAFT_1269642 [Suillus placidus]|uniref:Uncharacterized protein n=1 Tax=Suillus placidus TaxID=48579 RepID=A0A9P6ZRF1_9AGAM|nr:hypothetical protein EV702DRAFT_1269642 [Suillus placidus]